MNSELEFPKQIFPDINANDFNKHQKKNISEDFVAENLEYAGWKVYTPFVDTGMDLIASKTINGKRITRFIQVKTRALTDENIFGYTLKPKDFRDDPRHVFLLYSDSTGDFFILPMYEYLNFFMSHKKAGISHFAGKSFRVENNKINSLKYYPAENEFKFANKSFEAYRNKKGLNLIESTDIEEEFDALIEKIRDMKVKLFYQYNETWLKTKIQKNDSDAMRQSRQDLKNTVVTYFNNMIKETDEERQLRFERIKNNFKEEHPALYESHKRYAL